MKQVRLIGLRLLVFLLAVAPIALADGLPSTLGGK